MEATHRMQRVVGLCLGLVCKHLDLRSTQEHDQQHCPGAQVTPSTYVGREGQLLRQVGTDPPVLSSNHRDSRFFLRKQPGRNSE